MRLRCFRTALALTVVFFVAGCDEHGSATTPTPTAPPTGMASATPTPTATPPGRIAYEMVLVGDPGNAPDATGYGAVGYAYRIGRYEVTIGQYTAFLNAVARSDPHALYDPRMAGDKTVAGISRNGADGDYGYGVTGPSGIAPPGAASGAERPMAYVSWYTAARFANWMANGQPSGAQDGTTTEDGAYDLSAATSGAAVARNDVNPNTGAAPTFHIPTEDEWYKAAYYSPSGGGTYFRFATQSDTPPGNVLGGEANQANYIVDTTGYSVYSVTQLTNLDVAQNYLSDVGAFTASASAWGTFDQTGNVWEWNDLDGRAGPFRILRGGAWTSTPPYLQSTLRLGYAPGGVNSNSGFRLASPVVGSESPRPASSRAAVGRTAAVTGPPRAAAACAAAADPAEAVTIEMVRVGDAGNAADESGFGGVDYAYAIARYDVTIGQYAAFLNAVAATDTHALYHPSMAADTAIAGIEREGEPGCHTYRVMDNGGSSADRPITYVSWWDAARFANWMANGQPRGAQDDTTTEDGAYAVNGATGGAAVPLNAVNPNTGAPPAFSIPLENEWYKAAYYSAALPGGGAGYFDYATQSDTPPDNAIGEGANRANYFEAGAFAVTGASAQEPGQNYLTDVGAFGGSASFYGTFDQNGNVWQWNDLDGSAGASRGLRGGYWFSGALALEASLFCNDTTARESNDLGFRLAGPPPAPEP